MPAPEVIAHRGASAAAPEHTLAAYDLAVAHGADVLELDVRATADGTLVVVHDPTLARTAGDPRRVDAVTFAELPAFRRPLTLEAVLARYGAAARLLVELKDPDPAWEQRVADAIERCGLRDRAVVQSFDALALRRMRTAAPWLSCAALLRRRPSVRRLDTLAAFAGGIGVWHRQIDAGLVAAAHARGMAVRAWTVNAPEAMARLLALGVDGLITDVPDVAAGLLATPAAAREAA